MQSKHTAVYLFVVFVAVAWFVPIRVSGQSGTGSHIVAAIDNTKMTALRGNVHPLARSEFDRGPAPTSLSLDHMLLVLRRSPEQQAALETLLAQQQDPSSPNYRKWLTPEQFGQQFGPSTQDIQKITAWLQSQGFQVDEVAKGGTVIDFSGTAGQVQQAFHASIHRYVLGNGEQHWANSNDPQIPNALAPVVAGIASLNNFQRKRMSHNLGIFRRSKDGKTTAVKPQVSFAGGCNGNGTNCYAVGPADFAKIYNVPSSVTGAGQTIAIVSDSDVSAADVTAFRTLFGLPAINFQQIETSATDPGIQPCANNGNECEAVLDVEWAGAVAIGAKIDLVVSPSTNVAFGGDTSALYIINNNLASILSYSYGACELELGTSGNTFYQMMWSQAASQGITVLVSTGDNGAAGCDVPDPTNVISAQPATMGLAVNGVGSTPFNVAVGGTDFSDVVNPTTYWNNSNTTGQASAKSYIPEVAYNDSCSNPIFASAVFAGLAGLSTNPESNCNDPQLINFEGSGINLIASFGGGGGMSNCTTNATTSTTLGSVSSCSGGYTKPSWQTGPGVPNDGKRDTPDISVFSGDGTLQNFYIVCEADENGDANTTCNLNSPFLDFEGVGGTSVSAQAFAGIVALIDQQTNSRQGNINPMLYALAAGQATASCNASATPASTCVFNDVTSGTIAMPCAKNSPNCTVSNSGDTIGILSGFNAGVGFDLATGLGSVNVGNLVSKAGPNFYLSSSNPVVTVSSPGASGTMTVNAYPVNGFTGTVNLACSGLPTGATCSFNPNSVVFTSSTSASTGIPITVSVNTTSASVASPWNHFRKIDIFPIDSGAIATAFAFAAVLFLAAGRMGNRWSVGLPLILVLGGIAACGGGGGSPTSTTTLNIAGNWTFTATSSKFGSQFSAAGTVAQNGSNVSASLALASDPCGTSGTLSGTLSGSSLMLTLNESGQTVTFSGTVAADGNSASGNYSGAVGGCINGDMGTWVGVRSSASTVGGPVANVSPATLTFSNQNLNTTSVSQAVTLSNTGSATLSVLNVATSGDFAQSNNCGSAVVNGSKCTINVTFTPTATGTRTGSLSVQDNATASPQMVSLSGTGVTSGGAGNSGTPTGTSSATLTATASNLAFPLRFTLVVQ